MRETDRFATGATTRTYDAESETGPPNPETYRAAFSPAMRPELMAKPKVLPLRTTLYVSDSQPPVSLPAAKRPGMALYRRSRTSMR